jgi:hypothetical protein
MNLTEVIKLAKQTVVSEAHQICIFKLAFLLHILPSHQTDMLMFFLLFRAV